MVIYRPQKGSLSESMELAQEFNSFDEMKEYIVQDYAKVFMEKTFDTDDIVIDRKTVINDRRIGWEDTMYVCIKRFWWVKYNEPECIGMCATKYPKSKNGCKFIRKSKKGDL